MWQHVYELYSSKLCNIIENFYKGANMTYDFYFEHFFERYPRYRKTFGKLKSVEDLYEFLKSADAIEQMITANTYGLPALSGVVKEIENNFDNRKDLDLSIDFVRQMVGCMVQEILYFFGYKSRVQKVIRNAKYFKSATNYEFDEKLAKYKIIKRPIIEKY